MKYLTASQIRRIDAETTVKKQARCDEFNAKYPVGTAVEAFPGFISAATSKKVSKTSSPATLLGGHTPVVWLECGGGAISLTHVYPLEVKDGQS